MALDIKAELPLGLILTAIHRDKVFWTTRVGNVGSTAVDPGCLSAPGLCQPGASARAAARVWAGAKSLCCACRAVPPAWLGFLGTGELPVPSPILCYWMYPTCRRASSQGSQHTGVDALGIHFVAGQREGKPQSLLAQQLWWGGLALAQQQPPQNCTDILYVSPITITATNWPHLKWAWIHLLV